MIQCIRNNRKLISVFLSILIANQFFSPVATYALTGGPTQPEVQSFTPAGTNDMVDLFTGDFSYNIPLFELPGPNGGYPFNLSYQAGIGMDQEASWVGLGWNLNPGAITRQMRGLPDEFKKENVTTKMSMDPSVTVGLSAGIGIEVFGGDATIGVGVGVTQNNYRGLGYSIDASMGYSGTVGNSMSGGIGMNLTMDSKEGVNVSPSLSLDLASVGADYNSKQGLSSVSLTQSSTPRQGSLSGKNRSSLSRTSTLSLASPGYTPQVTMPMINDNITATLKLGGSWWGIFGAPYARGFYNEQQLKNNDKSIPSPAYGYFNYQYAVESNAIMDFNREKDGMVMKESPNLAIPSMTYDIYSATGQGISAMYRPIRNDHGLLHDPETVSTSISGSAGADIAPALSHIGANLTVNHSKSVSGPWTSSNELPTATGFSGQEIDNLYEPWYFKVHGEPDADKQHVVSSLGGDGAVSVQLEDKRDDPKAMPTLLTKSSGTLPIPTTQTIEKTRKPRNQTIQPITNDQLLNGASEEMLSYFRIHFIDENNTEREFVRTAPGHHIAAFTALTPDGLRYNYGIPAYNNKQEETVFTAEKDNDDINTVDVGKTSDEGDPDYKVENTEKFLKTVELPKYAHSHLLTSIIGPDYVDVDGNGVSDNDLGYWVKFTYQRVTSDASPYKWRDPFQGAHFQEGFKTDPRDDKGSYTYGEKEIWYLRRAETKSHKAEFILEDRDDARGVAYRLQDPGSSVRHGGMQKRLKEIKLFSKLAIAVPIKVTKFHYDNSLCKEVFNALYGGKLTLTGLHFEYGGSQRGALNSYEFLYKQNDQQHNPNYDIMAYDRWGNYKPYPVGDPHYNRDFPYVNQDPSKKDEIDKQAAVWSLKEIHLPSGGSIEIDYETDDYGYVQHLPAMQMVEVVSPEGDPMAEKFSLSDDETKVRFKLEASIPGESAPQKRAEVLKYLDQRNKQLFFKYLINLRGQGESFEEYITGYVDIDFDKQMDLEKGGSGDYEYGFFHVKTEDTDRNPFSLRAWQHLRTNQPELANSGRKLNATSNTKDRVDQIRSLGGIGGQVLQMFKGFYPYCSGKGWGREVNAKKSWIRLNSPDKIKYGGGLRVKQITMKDAWTDSESVYGQIYTYTTEENGTEISSGVAAYEPIVGGEENPLRYAKKFVKAVPLKSRNNLYFEYPINESYYPGPQVGYSKVTVTSLASANLNGATITMNNGDRAFPENTPYGTTGKTVHEFYTARDFPVIADETTKENRSYKLTVPVPLLGSISFSKLTASQGYSIATNDMHGKQKKVSNYRQESNGKFEPDPISWVKYNYFQEERMYDQQKVHVLRNTLADIGDGILSRPVETGAQTLYTIGQETEFFYDMREFKDHTWGGGVNVNSDMVIVPLLFIAIPVTIPSVWPSVSESTVQLRTAVTNKIIFKSGILESTEAFDGGSLVKTENLKWDKLTGATVLTRVDNNFGAPIYSFNIPAYTKYQGMGAAYKNIGMEFTISSVAKTQFKETLYTFSTPGISDEVLFPGDEILLFTPEGTRPFGKAVYQGREGTSKVLYSAVNLSGSDFRGMIIRSGFRNQLSVSAGSITALSDPSSPGIPDSFDKTVQVPR